MPLRKINNLVKYKFDSFMSKGVISLIAGLFILSVLFVVIISIIGAFVGIATTDQQFSDFGKLMWDTVLHSLDGGVLASLETNSTAYIVLMLIATLGGMVLISILIGVLNSGIAKQLDELRKGRSLVIENEHTVILGWSPQIFYIVNELITANEGKKGSCISILAEKDKVEMEDEISMKVIDFKNTKVVCRTGNPIDLTDLEIINPHTAKSIIILSPEGMEDPDSLMIKMILAITNNPQRRPESYHIVAEIRDPKNIEVARLVGKNEVSFILMEDVLSKIIAQTCRQSGLSVVFNELLDFKRNKINFLEEQSLIGKQFSKALFSYNRGTPIGLKYSNGSIELNPPSHKLIERGDKIIVVAEDGSKINPVNNPELNIDATTIRQTERANRNQEKTLILGWNRQAHTIITELDNYVVKDSIVTVVSDSQHIEHEIALTGKELKHLKMHHIIGDTSNRRVLDSLECETYDHIIILSHSITNNIQESDARTIFTLLHLRDIAEKSGHPFSIVSQMLDIRNRELVKVTRADDFVVSDKLNSLMLSQVSEEKALALVFEDLFRSEGSEVYLKPASDYVELRKPINFFTVVESARRKNEIAIGCRLLSKYDEDALDQGVIVNPDKTKNFTFFEEDKIIVLAENDW
jgi:voltage-gated potassium channel Kch